MNSGFANNTRTLSGVNEINVDKINVDNNVSAITIKGDKGLVGQTIQKGTDNRLQWGFVDDIEIPDGSITGAKLAPDIDIDTTGDIDANTITVDTTLNLPNTTTAINIGGDIGHGEAGQVLAKNSDTNKLEWDFVNDITIPNRSIEGIKLKLLTIEGEVIALRTIDHEKLILKTITDAEIADNTITTLNIGAKQVTSAEIDDKTITAGQIAEGTITDDEIHANTITASDKLVANSITGTELANDIGITTTGNIQGYEITATHRFIQTGLQINTFAGGLTTSKGYLQTNGADVNIFAGQTFLEKAGGGTPPTTLADGGYALQVGDGSTQADVYIKRNLVVDGTIHGNIEGDITDNHIDCQSLVVEDKSVAGATGITVKDNYDIILEDNQAGSRNTTILLDSSTGDITTYSGSIVFGGQTGKIKGWADNPTEIEDVDFSSDTLVDVVENRVGRTFTKRWMPVLQYGTGEQVNWSYYANIVPTANWHDFSGEYDAAGTMTPRHLLDITNVKIRTTRVKARISINMACNYQFGIRLSWRTGQGTIGNPYSDWSTEEAYLAFGDDWITDEGDKEGYLGQGQWKWDFPVMNTIQNVYYSFMPEVFIAYNMTIGSPTSAVQFWVGSSYGNDAPTEDTKSDMPAIFEVIEIPATLFQESTAAGTYPAALSSSSEEGG